MHATEFPETASCVAISLGSNLGDRTAHFVAARSELDRILRGVSWSMIYETEPVGFEGEQPAFLNACCTGRTALPPRTLLERLAAVEQSRGRTRDRHRGPRTLDLDLILYGDRTLREPGLEVPHPRMEERGFVLVPLDEIAPDWMHPALGLSVRELKERVDTSGVRVYGKFSGEGGSICDGSE